jgi:hypothetical protein
VAVACVAVWQQARLTSEDVDFATAIVGIVVVAVARLALEM